MEKREKPERKHKKETHTKTRRQQHARLAVVPRGNNQLSRSGRRHCCWPSESLPQPMAFLLFPPLFPPRLALSRPARCCLLWGNKMSKSSGRRHGKWSRLSRTTQPRPSACLLPSTDYSLPTYPSLVAHGAYTCYSVHCIYNFVIVCNILNTLHGFGLLYVYIFEIFQTNRMSSGVASVHCLNWTTKLVIFLCLNTL